jgi:uncharacterized protein (DUF4415 family)
MTTSLTPSEIKRIRERIAKLPEPYVTDADNPQWTREDFARAKGPESLPPEVLALLPDTVARLEKERLARVRGPGKKPKKAMKTLRLDPDVLRKAMEQGF